MKRRALFALSAFGLLCAGCGYHVAGQADTLPKSIRTIAVPAFQNATARYRLAERLPAAITHELIARTRYNVVADPDGADAVLTGSVNKYVAYPTTFDPTSGRASAVQLSVYLTVTLTDRATGKVLYSRRDFEARERYEISTDQRAYLEESDAALDRLSRDVARMVVSAVLENF